MLKFKLNNSTVFQLGFASTQSPTLYCKKANDKEYLYVFW